MKSSSFGSNVIMRGGTHSGCKMFRKTKQTTRTLMATQMSFSWKNV